MGGATKLLEYMRSLDMPISERIYASLVTGHARAGDLHAAAGVLETMKRNGLIPHNVVYTSLLCAHAERGDIKQIESVSYLCSQSMHVCVYVPIRCLDRCVRSVCFPV